MRKNMDMLHGSLYDKIIVFAIPLACSGILQQFFNACDTMVVGRFASSQALAAVGANSSPINMLLNIFIGLSVGTNVVTAKYIGQGNKERVKKAVHTSILLAIVCGIVLIFVGIGVSKTILEAMNTPSDIIDMSTIYMRIYFVAIPFILLYNFGSAVLRSIGDTKRPMYALIASGIVNLILNLFFVIVCKLSVVGVAIATDVSNTISACLIIYFLLKETNEIHLDLHQLSIDKETLSEVMKVGIPAGVQGLVFSISNVLIQVAMNGLGSDVVAASSAALNYEIFVYYILNAFGQACVTFVSQNYGVGNYGRCKRVIVLSTLLSAFFCMALGSIFILCRHPLLALFTKREVVIKYGSMRMIAILSFEFLNSSIETISGGLRGIGRSTLPAVITIAGICGVRLYWIYFVFPKRGTFDFLMWAYPVSWIVTFTILLCACLYVCKKQLQ